MSNYFKLIITSIIIVMTFSSIGQVSQKAMKIPIKYQTPIENVSLTPSDIRRPGSYWIVYSDKNANKTYEDPNGKKIKRTIGFMENFYVAEENELRVHIIKDHNYSEEEGFSSNLEDFGWIEKENLLLWDHCLVTEKGKINKKGMILNTIESLKKEKIEKGDEENVKYYYNDKLSVESETGRTSKIYEILYIYKVKGDAILLGKTYFTDVSRAKEMIFGWVSSKKITIWDHRIAVEPNWEKEAALERKAHNIRATFLVDVPKAKRYAEAKPMNDRYVIWNNDTYEKRNIGDWRRFPLLMYDKESQIIKAGVMSELRSALDKADTIGTVSLAEIQRNYNELRAKARNINVVFVVDGTKSMDLYFPAISKAIIASMDKLKKSYSKNSMRFGAVVYTDNAEKNMLIQAKKLNSNYREVAGWLSPNRVYHKYDKDTPEAVNYGLMAALRSVGLQKNETNIIILVGDAGNHHRQDRSQIDKSEIIKLLDMYDCNFLAFQVHNENHSSYDEFEPQMKDLISSTAMLKYQQNKKIAKLANYNLQPPRFRKIGIGTYILDTTTMIGTVILAQKGKPLSPTQLQNEISRTVQFSNDLLERKLNRLEQVIAEGGSFTDVLSDNNGESFNDESSSSQSSFAPAMFDILSKMNLSERKLKIILSENYQLYFPAYSPMRINGLKHDIYKQVLFMDANELGDLLSTFDKLVDANTSNGQRQKLKEVWLEVLQNHLGDKFTRDKAENMTFEEINEEVYGLPGTSDLLHTRLGDITQVNKVSDDQIYSYTVKIKRKRGELHRIFHAQNYEYDFYSYDNHYYWIAQDLLP